METDKKPGKVYLIGAGPGDPGLITLKGRECLNKADVVIYDHLANPRLLAHAKPETEKMYVGKRSDEHTVEQERINELLVEEARRGRTVARLKGGDAFIFGRGGEEALFLAENEIDFEIVPGVSSAYAVPAYAGIPVTHRGLASDVSFITGHAQQSGMGPGISWEMLAKSGGTLVFLMGVKNLSTIAQELVRHGKSARTPAAVVRWGTMTDQQTLTGTLEDIAEKVRTAKFRTPAIVVVGEVVKLREKLAWFEKRPLFGRRIIITRAAGQQGSLGSLLEEAGAEIIEFPTIEIQPVDDYSVFDNAVKKMAENIIDGAQNVAYDWAIFTSANTVAFMMERLRYLNLDLRALGGIRLAAVGSATATALTTHNLVADLVPEDFRAEGLIEEFSRQDMTGQKILLPRAREARGILPKRLQEMGADVTIAPMYQNVPANPPIDQIREAFAKDSIDCITFTSGSTVRNFARLMSGENDSSPGVGSAKIAAIGPVTARAAAKYGLNTDIMPAKSTIVALVESIKQDLAGDGN